MTDNFENLPLRKRNELERVARILFDEFEDAQKGKLSDKHKNGRILKLILFGSYARGDWVEDRKSGYRSDYDLLVVVNAETFTDPNDYWDRATERLVRETTVTKHLATPVNLIVHSIMDLNDQLAHGRPFFTDIARDGIVIYEVPGYPLAAPKKLTDLEMRAEARQHFNHWFPDTIELQAGALFYRDRGNFNLAAFQLHQAAERLYHCVLLVVTLYSPKSHRLTFLRSHAERTDARLIDVWPRDTRFAKRCFARLDRAYVDARYSPKYVIIGEELAWLVERVKVLQETVATICAERLESEGKAGTWTYDNIAAAETAIAIINQARGMVSARIREVKDTNGPLVRQLRAKRRELLALQQSIIPDDPDTAKAITATWGPRVKDEERFWREL